MTYSEVCALFKKIALTNFLKRQTYRYVCILGGIWVIMQIFNGDLLVLLQ